MRYAEGHDSTQRREDGFLRGLAPHAGIQILSSNQHVGADVEGAYKRAEALARRNTRPATARSAWTASLRRTNPARLR